jgi:hypothetical protein
VKAAELDDPRVLRAIFTGGIDAARASDTESRYLRLGNISEPTLELGVDGGWISVPGLHQGI